MDDDDVQVKWARIANAPSLADHLRAVLDYYAVLTEESWWPYDQDSLEFKRGAMREDHFWRTQIEQALTDHEIGGGSP